MTGIGQVPMSLAYPVTFGKEAFWRMVTGAPISKSTAISEVLQMYPGAMAVFQAHGMDCTDCMGATGETLESGARMCRADIDTLLDDLNRLIAAVGQE